MRAVGGDIASGAAGGDEGADGESEEVEGLVKLSGGLLGATFVDRTYDRRQILPATMNATPATAR